MAYDDFLPNDSYCGKCGMTFCIGNPHQGEHVQCPEGNCGRPFWSESVDYRSISSITPGETRIRVGMTPEQYRYWMQDKDALAEGT